MQPEVEAFGYPKPGVVVVFIDNGRSFTLTPSEATRLANDLTDAVDILDGRT